MAVPNSSGDATVYHVNLKTVPILSSGNITPASLFAWEAGCHQYFRHKGVEKENQVAFVSGGLQDPHVMDWWMTYSDELELLSFVDFMMHLQDHWLPLNWADSIIASMHASGQREDVPLANWITTLEKQNTFLRDTPRKFTELQMRDLIVSKACEEICLLAVHPAYRDIPNYNTWKTTLIAYDHERIMSCARLQRQMEQFSKTIKSTSGNGYVPAKTLCSGNNSNTSATSSAKTSDWLPRLNDEEQRLLRENKGCFKCHHVNVGHNTKDCTLGFPTRNTYKTPAEQLASAIGVKKENRKVAAIVVNKEDNYEDVSAVAALRTLSPSPLASTTGVLSSRDDLDDDVHTHSKITSPHLTWSVHVKSPSESPIVTALVDTGSPLVLIRDDVVRRLQLHHHTLHKAVPLGRSEGVGQTDGFNTRPLLDCNFCLRRDRSVVMRTYHSGDSLFLKEPYSRGHC